MAKAKSAAKAAPKRTKAGKDPNAPKRGMSAYMLWMQANRDRIKEPGMGVTDIAKKAGALWKEVKDKPKWEAKAAEEKKRYEREMADYKKKGGAAAGGSAATKTAKKPAKKAAAASDDDDDEMDGDESDE